MSRVPLPDWARRHAEPGDVLQDDAQLIDAAVAIACESAERSNGPFGAVIADEDGRIIAAGFNHVVAGRDSTAHAEVHAMRRAQQRLDTHDLGATERGPLTMYASCEPCIMCFGAVYWSGLDSFLAAASADEAEAIGFMEGPVTDNMWARAREDKGIELKRNVTGQRDPGEPFRIYERSEGIIY